MATTQVQRAHQRGKHVAVARDSQERPGTCLCQKPVSELSRQRRSSGDEVWTKGIRRHSFACNFIIVPIVVIVLCLLILVNYFLISSII